MTTTGYYIVFEDCVGERPKEYRSYPAVAQWANRKLLAEWLHNRTFLTDYIVTKVKEF